MSVHYDVIDYREERHRIFGAHGLLIKRLLKSAPEIYPISTRATSNSIGEKEAMQEGLLNYI